MAKRWGIWILIILASVFYSTYAITRHLRLESYIYDLGFYDQLVWLASQGKPLFLTMQEYHAWTGHFNPTMLLLAPLYWIWSDVKFLLIFQAVFACVGAYPIFLLARKKLQDSKLALFFGFIYLSFFGLSNALAYEFHPLTVAVPLFAWFLWFYENRQWKLFWLSFILFVFLQENFFLLGFSYGVFLMCKYRDFRRGIGICIGTLIGYLLAVFIIMPSVGAREYIFLPTEFMNPFTAEKLYLVFVTLLSFAFLPVLSPWVFLILLEEWGTRFMVSPGANYWSFGYHYNAMLTPILAYGAIDALKKHRWLQKYSYFILALGFFVSYILVKPDVLRMAQPGFFDTSRSREAQKVFDLIPSNASVAATNNLGPHLTHRDYVTFLTNCRDNPQEWVWVTKRCFKKEVDYIIADLSPNVGNNIWPDNNLESITGYLNSLQQSGEYRLKAQEGTIVLLERVVK